MTPDFFARITLTTAELRDVVGEYQDWAVGDGPFSRSRKGRLTSGAPTELRGADLDAAGDYPGVRDFVVSVRHEDRRSLLRLVHRDGDDGAILWHNIVRLSQVEAGVAIEHAIARTAPRETFMSPKAAAPRVLGDIIELHRGSGVVPSDFDRDLVVVSNAMEAKDFVDSILLNKNRTAPLLLVTPGAASREPSIDAEEAVKRLRACAIVAEATSRDATEAIASEMHAAGLARGYSCFDGGVRLYWPRVTTTDGPHRHPLWIRSWLNELGDPRNRTEALAGVVARHVANAMMPSGFLWVVQEHDRVERHASAKKLIAQAMLAEKSGEDIAKLKVALREAHETVDVYADDQKQMQDALADAKANLAAREYELQVAGQISEELREQLDATKRKTASAVPDDVRRLLASLVTDELTPERALYAVDLAWPDRLVVLDTARKSARSCAVFKHPKSVLDLLVRLVTKYRDAILKGVADAHTVFGHKEYAPTESERISKAGTKRRTFVYEGKDVEMLAHLKIGVKLDSIGETLRIHFAWDPKTKKIVVGHCGPHLDL